MVGIWSGPFTLANLLVLVAIGLLACGVLPVCPAWIAGAGVLAVAGVWWDGASTWAPTTEANRPVSVIDPG